MKNLVRIGIILAGVYLPWLAIDSLFFDEFFMWQWFFALGVHTLCQETDTPEDALLTQAQEAA